ncbi:hypothetical protein Tco_1091023 [Tanacetum coccineum]|uniref:C2H2-type domain-containing protein n=1 Tax=Tanacetum coccineum TaxID=301880 RepID=A0ABQ5I782_9ASTR
MKEVPQPQILIISKPEPCNNQTVNEFPQTLPSVQPTSCTGGENSFTYDSKPNFVDNSPNVFNPPPQPPMYSCEFCGNDARYGHYSFKEHYETIIDSNNDSTSSDNDSYENIDYVDASPPDAEPDSLECRRMYLPGTESFCFDMGENSSGSTTTHSDYSLPDYEAFYSDNDHIGEKSSGSTTTHADFSKYDSPSTKERISKKRTKIEAKVKKSTRSKSTPKKSMLKTEADNEEMLNGGMLKMDGELGSGADGDGDGRGMGDGTYPS